MSEDDETFLGACSETPSSEGVNSNKEANLMQAPHLKHKTSNVSWHSYYWACYAKDYTARVLYLCLCLFLPPAYTVEVMFLLCLCLCVYLIRL